jgi:hypothetical protein
VIASAIRAVVGGWMPVADQGVIATRAYDVFTTHGPLLGQYTTASEVTGRATYSPGPLLYWLLAVPARVGPPALLMVTMAAVNTAAVVWIVALARRRGGPVLMLLTAVAMVVLCRSWAPESLHAIYNGAAPLLLFTLLIFLCWSLACGDHRVLPVVTLVASFVVQTHLVFLPPTLGLLAVGLTGLVVARRHVAAHEAARAARERRGVRATVLVAVLVAAATWSAPVYQEITARHGNLTALVATATAPTAKEGGTVARRAVIRAIGVRPRWLRGPRATAGRIGSLYGGDYGDTRLADIWAPPGTVATGSAALLLLGLLALGATAARRRRGDLVAGAMIALLLCASLGAVAATTPVALSATLGYGLWWGSAAGMWVWLILIWSAASLSPPLVRGVAAVPKVVVLLLMLVVAGVVITASQKADAHSPFYRPTRSLAAQLNRAIPAGRTVWLVQRGWSGLTVIKPAVRYTLRRHDVRALAPGSAIRFGSWYELLHRHHDARLALVADAPHGRGLIVARSEMTGSKGRRVITGVLSVPIRPGPR